MDTQLHDKNARNILLEARRRNIRLIPHGKILLVDYPKNSLDAAFEAILLANKPALLRLLCGYRHAARQIMAGEFDGGNARLWFDLKEMMLENYLDPLCHHAVAYLDHHSQTCTYDAYNQKKKRTPNGVHRGHKAPSD